MPLPDPSMRTAHAHLADAAHALDAASLAADAGELYAYLDLAQTLMDAARRSLPPHPDHRSPLHRALHPITTPTPEACA